MLDLQTPAGVAFKDTPMVSPRPSPDPSPELARSGNASGAFARMRCRSFCFLELNGEPWTAFLVTYAQADGFWRGHFMFRSGLRAPDAGEIRTADLFVEISEDAVDARARSLGKPLLEALLQSAVHTQQARKAVSPDYARWFRDLLARHSAQLSSERAVDPAPSLRQLKSLYDSYRVDQVSHLIALIDPDDFRALTARLLEGREIDFRARDRFQLAMIVVQELERRLLLPPFEVWAEDYLAHRNEYESYTARLHAGELP